MAEQSQVKYLTFDIQWCHCVIAMYYFDLIDLFTYYSYKMVNNNSVKTSIDPISTKSA